MASSAKASPKNDEKSQYHHYIPRFILKNFAHPFRPPKTPKGAKQSRKKGFHLNEPVLYCIDLQGSAPWIKEVPVSRTFGLKDMYRDFTAAANQHDLEKQLSHLESETGRIIADIRKAHEEGEKHIQLSRAQKDIIRKFFFVMKYRSSGFHRRFCHLRVEDYNEDDADQFKEYMLKEGYERPIDVWFSSIKALIEVHIDADNLWKQFLREKMYPGDAEWAIASLTMYYMAICTPSQSQDEFLLTQNAYSIFEGPSSSFVDADTGKVATPYTEFHMFAPISPKLLLVLRSLLLPEPNEDRDESTRSWRKEMYRLNANQHAYPSHANSSLEDLPVQKARNTYRKFIDGKFVFAHGEDGKHKPSHSFYFQFFPISTSHVNKINFIMLEESHSISIIAFKGKEIFGKTLESYLTLPVVNANYLHSMKTVGSSPNDPRRACLERLEQAAMELGVNVTATYATSSTIDRLAKEKDMEELQTRMAESARNALPTRPTKVMALYNKLGGSVDTLMQDLDQARKMLNMRIKIDVWSKGIDEDTRRQNRENLADLYCQLLPRRIWLYMKYVRHLELDGRGKTRELDLSLIEGSLSGPEDVIAEVSHLFRPTSLSHVMYYAVLNQIFLTRNSHLGKYFQVQALGFGPAGSICNCGISALERKAESFILTVHNAGFLENLRNPKWSEMQNIEMATRVLLRRTLKKVLGNQASAIDLEALDKVLFDTVYLVVAF